MTFSIIKKLRLEGALRLDAEYYQPEFLEAEKLVEEKKHVKFGEIINLLTDYHANGSYETLHQNVEISSVPDYSYMVRAVDLENLNFEGDVRYVSRLAYQFLKKSKIYGNEIIIDKIGNAGTVYFMPNLDKPVTLGMNLLLVRLKKEFSPEFIYIFFNSKHGKLLIERNTTGINPKSIDKNSVRNILIPVVSESFNEQISLDVQRSLNCIADSKEYYRSAKDLLLKELGLDNFEAEKNLFSIVNLSDCQKANRIDAEYFQPKFAEVVSKIKQRNPKKLGEIVSMTKGFEPGGEAYQEEGKCFIRVSSLSKDGINENDQKYLKDDLYQNLKSSYQPRVGEILLTKDATPGIAYTVKKPIEGIISGGILRLKLKVDIEPEYLTLCLNSIVGKMQTDRDAGGSIISHWKPDQVKEILIPILPEETQEKIAELVRKSHTARQKSKELLEEAKRNVEEMIEN